MMVRIVESIQHSRLHPNTPGPILTSNRLSLVYAVNGGGMEESGIVAQEYTVLLSEIQTSTYDRTHIKR